MKYTDAVKLLEESRAAFTYMMCKSRHKSEMHDKARQMTQKLSDALTPNHAIPTSGSVHISDLPSAQ